VRLLLLSNSEAYGRGFLEHAFEAITDHLAGRDELLFVPFALADHDWYAHRVGEALRPLGLRVRGLHAAADPVAALREASAVFVGGGNTFRLLATLQRRGLVDPLREAVRDGGVPYLGSSAGTNLGAPSIRTTNDMPIVQPESFTALGLVPFQINPHYLDPDPNSTFMGETRDQRLTEFLEENDVPVLALREGTWLQVRDGRAVLGGDLPARLFRRGESPRELPAGSDVSFLLDTVPVFDRPAQG